MDGNEPNNSDTENCANITYGIIEFDYLGLRIETLEKWRNIVEKF